MKRIALAALVSGMAMIAAAPANAATTVSRCDSIGTAAPSTGCNISFTDGLAGTWGNPNVVVSSFTDVYNFDIASTGILGLTLSSIASSAASDIAFSIANLTSPTGVVTPLSRGSTGVVEFYSLSGLAATAGQYTLTLTGTVAGTPPSAAYSGTLSFAPTPTAAVPEPAAWGMMIMGLGLVGAALRRRRTSVSFA